MSADRVPEPPNVLADRIGSASIPIRYEDIAQDGRLALEGLAPAAGRDGVAKAHRRLGGLARPAGAEGGADPHARRHRGNGRAVFDDAPARVDGHARDSPRRQAERRCRADRDRHVDRGDAADRAQLRTAAGRGGQTDSRGSLLRRARVDSPLRAAGPTQGHPLRSRRRADARRAARVVAAPESIGDASSRARVAARRSARGPHARSPSASRTPTAIST